MALVFAIVKDTDIHWSLTDRPENSVAFYIMHSAQISHPISGPGLLVVREYSRSRIWLYDLRLRAFEKLPSEALPACGENPREVPNPFIRTLGACLLEHSGWNRKHSRWPTESPLSLLDAPWYLHELEQAIDHLRYMSEMVDTMFGGPFLLTQHPVRRDFGHVVQRYELVHRAVRKRLNDEASMASLKESRLRIQ